MDKFFSKKRLLVFIGLVFIVSVLSAGTGTDKRAGEFGLQFLKIPVSPELSGMGGTGDMLHSSPLNIFHHPAAFDWQRGASVAASQNSWLFETNMYSLAWKNVMFNQAFGLGLKYLDYGQFDKRTETGKLVGSYYPMNLRVTANYARRLTPDIYAGLNVNLLYEKIDTSSALAFTTDLGFAYLTPLRNTSVDFAVKNLGMSGKMDEEKIDIPIIADMGVTTGFDINDFTKLSPAFKLVYMQDHDSLLPAIGANIKLFDLLALRVGYKFNYNEEDLSAGFGVTIRNFNLNYSFMNSINGVHKFAICYRF